MADQKMKCVFFKGVCVFPVDPNLKCQSATLFQEVDIPIKIDSKYILNYILLMNYTLREKQITLIYVHTIYLINNYLMFKGPISHTLYFCLLDASLYL